MTEATLVESIRELREAPDAEIEPRLRAVLQALVQSELLAGRERPGEPLATIDDDDGGEVLVLFTEPLEIHFHDPDLRPVPMRGEDAVRRVAAGDYDGLAINPGGKIFELSREDVLEFYDID